ncbi:hypothetical protein Rhopal_004270-T1 [Rhodotorula paludigena]|uniref:F-box domain-containing protein n=1 Tax=Rhodotorula paludigena TaxID=86838 RepID=A0AAV5GQF5_9BASI|nr:hypothetical protein Rhopal_004270-T1 [Rhodotorula paludigena]
MAGQDSETDVSSFQGPETAGATLRDLPHELLRYIVELVAEQDDEVLSGSVRVARVGQDGSDRLSSWYARGVGALSCLNKHMRRLSLPHLCRTVSAKQLAQPIVQMRRISPAILAGIRTLDLRHHSESTFVAAGLALPRLIQLRHVRLSARSFVGMQSATLAAAVGNQLAVMQLALDAFASCAHNIEQITLVHSAGTAFDEAYLPIILRAHKNLRRLRLFDAEYTVFSDLEGLWHPLPVLPELRELVISAADLSVLPFVLTLAPNVEDLTINFDPRDIAEDLRADDDVAHVSLPHLRRLKLEGGPSVASRLACINLMTLEFLELRIVTASEGKIHVDCAALFPSNLLLPAGLVFKLVTHHLLAVQNFDALTDLCDKHGATLNWYITHLLAPFNPPERSTIAESETTVNHQRALAVSQLLDWANARSTRLAVNNDVEGTEELAVAMRRVEEKKIIDEL